MHYEPDIMNQTQIWLAMLTLALAPAARSADGTFAPVDNKSVVVFKTTPRGDLL